MYCLSLARKLGLPSLFGEGLGERLLGEAGVSVREAFGVGFPVSTYISEASFTHNSAAASLGIRQSPRGLRLMLPTFGPSGRQLRLNC